MKINNPIRSVSCLLFLSLGTIATLSAQGLHAVAGAPAAGQNVFISRATTVGGEPHAAEPVTFLGVVTSRFDPALTAQLGLQKDMGLVVSSIQAGSPAEGVLKRYDILLKLNDQLLINVEQLSVLIRSFKEGDEVTLTFVRAGRQETAKVKLAQRLMPAMAWQEANRDVWQQFVPPSGATVAGGTVSVQRLPGAMAGEEVNRTLSLARPAFTFSTGAVPLARMVDGGRSNLVFSDDAGSLELKVDEGRKELVAKDPAGAVLFSGPINTDEERKAMPEAVRARLEKMEGIDTLQFRVGEEFKAGDVRIIAPRAEGVRLERAVRPDDAMRLL